MNELQLRRVVDHLNTDLLPLVLGIADPSSS